MSVEKPNKQRATIYDIAKASGFSTATVSLVMHGDQRVKESTRKKIQECMAALQYNPSYLASSLASQQTRNIGLVIPNLRNPVFAEMVEGVESYLQNENYHVIIGVTDQNLQKEKYYLSFIHTQKVDGLIVFPTFLNEIREDLLKIQEKAFPLVVCGMKMEEENDDINFVSSNIAEGAYLATEALIKKGHKHICLMSGEVSNQQSDERISGYRQALDIYGIQFRPELVLRSAPDLDSVYSMCYDFLGDHPEVTAFFCLYDYISLAVMKAIQRRGLTIPGDIALIGYDDIELNRYLPVELSSVYTNSFKVGETAARIVVNLLRHADAETQHIILPPTLVERNSS